MIIVLYREGGGGGRYLSLSREPFSFTAMKEILELSSLSPLISAMNRVMAFCRMLLRSSFPARWTLPHAFMRN